MPFPDALLEAISVQEFKSKEMRGRAMKLQKQLGEELRGKRKAAGVSLRFVAKCLKISPMYLSDLERGNRIWTAKRVNDFLAAL